MLLTDIYFLSGYNLNVYTHSTLTPYAYTHAYASYTHKEETDIYGYAKKFKQ